MGGDEKGTRDYVSFYTLLCETRWLVLESVLYWYLDCDVLRYGWNYASDRRQTTGHRPSNHESLVRDSNKRHVR